VSLPAPSGDGLQLVIAARKGAVPGVRLAVVAFAERAGAVPALQRSIGLAVSEAVTNGVLHAYADREPPGEVRIDAWLEDDGATFVVQVADGGTGLVPRDDSPGLGYGMRIMELATDGLAIDTRSGEGTTVTLRFALPGP
jgi:anti-sigma regulatory factor (Ser/Thr protein kinase)